MSIKSYVSKLYLAISISSNFSFIKFLINSKRYSNKFKSGTLDIKKEESIKYYFKFNGKKIDIMMRTFQGDIDIFYEIFWSRMYEVSEKYLSNPKIIVDLGAHIGFTSIYYGLNYPKAKIFSLEASKKNYSILAFNVKHFTNIKIFYKAVYTEDGVINFEDDGILSYNTKINKNGTPVGCISMNTFMEQNGIEKIDLLKTDIERCGIANI